MTAWSNVDRNQIIKTSQDIPGLASPPNLGFPISTLFLTFPYLGHRTYVQGVVGMHGMLETAALFAPDLLSEEGVVRQAKVLREINTYCVAQAMDRANASLHPLRTQATARLDLAISGKELTVLLFPVRDLPVTERLTEYGFGEYVNELHLGDNGNSMGTMHRMRDTVELLCGVEECFRDIILKEKDLPSGSLVIRWAYAEDFPFCHPERITKIGGVRFEPGKIIPSGQGYFDIRIGRMEGGDVDEPFTMCFFVEPVSGITP